RAVSSVGRVDTGGVDPVVGNEPVGDKPDGNTAQRFYAAPVEQVFATALRTAVELGYAIVSADPLDHRFAVTASPDAAGAADDFPVSVAGEGALACVRLTGRRVLGALAGRGRLGGPAAAPVAGPFLNALTRALDEESRDVEPGRGREDFSGA